MLIRRKAVTLTTDSRPSQKSTSDTHDVFIRMTPTLYKRLVGMVAVNPLKDKNGEAINMFAFDMSPNVTLILVEPTYLVIVMPEN